MYDYMKAPLDRRKIITYHDAIKKIESSDSETSKMEYLKNYINLKCFSRFSLWCLVLAMSETAFMHSKYDNSVRAGCSRRWLQFMTMIDNISNKGKRYESGFILKEPLTDYHAAQGYYTVLATYAVSPWEKKLEKIHFSNKESCDAALSEYPFSNAYRSKLYGIFEDAKVKNATGKQKYEAKKAKIAAEQRKAQREHDMFRFDLSEQNIYTGKDENIIEFSLSDLNISNEGNINENIQGAEKYISRLQNVPLLANSNTLFHRLKNLVFTSPSHAAADDLLEYARRCEHDEELREHIEKKCKTSLKALGVWNKFQQIYAPETKSACMSC